MPEKSVIAEGRVYNMIPEVKDRIDQIRHGIVPEGYRKAGIDIIPSDWDKSPFRQLGVIASGLVDPQKQPYSEMQHIGPDCIEKDTGRILETKSASELGLISGKFFFDSDSIVYSKIRPNLNKVCAPPFEGICSADCYSIKPTGKIEKAYLFNLMLGYNFYKRAIACSMRTGMPKINQDDLNAIAISYPQSTTEQKKIAEILSVQDKLIELEQRKIEEIKKAKRFFLEKMFPKKGQAVPEIRFKGFTAPWEKRKFSDITFPAGEKNKDNLPLESYSITNEYGFVPQDEKFENGGTMREADKRMYYIVSPNSFAYNPARINVGSIGYQNVGKNVIVSSLYEVFKTSEDVDDRLLWHWFKSPDFQKLIMQLQEGGVRLYFYYDKLCMGEVFLPSLEEQRKIGKLFDTIDHLITLHQRKLEEEKRKKKALMQLLLTGLVRVNA